LKDKRGILLIKRRIAPWKGACHFPGGTVQYKESLFHAAKRKAESETGLKVRIKEFLGVIQFFENNMRSGYGHIIDFEFLAEPIGGRLRTDYQGLDIRFFKKLPKNIITQQRDFLLNKPRQIFMKVRK
jgi:ADP-ribose pyrophosphatase YjhB (NUDIX family)